MLRGFVDRYSRFGGTSCHHHIALVFPEGSRLLRNAGTFLGNYEVTLPQNSNLQYVNNVTDSKTTKKEIKVRGLVKR